MPERERLAVATPVQVQGQGQGQVWAQLRPVERVPWARGLVLQTLLRLEALQVPWELP